MPRDAVAITNLTLDGAVDDPAGTAINATNGATIPAGGDTRGLLIVVTNTFAGAKVTTIKAGVNPPAHRRALGDLTESQAQNDRTTFVLEGGRFIQDDGSIWVDFEAAMTGTIRALRLPQGG